MFANAWNLGRISGIKIRLHWSFLILPAIVYFSALMDGGGFLAPLLSVAMVIAVFGCVLLHELGHAFAARGFGIGTRDILLLPIGGVASLERIPENPLQELWIAIAGPLVNVLIAIVLYFGLQYLPMTAGIAIFVSNLAFINLLLVAFNMIPAFPMDGGRVLRSFLAMFMNYVSATRIAATVGMYCALGLGIYGLFYDFMLVLLAGFVLVAGQAEKLSVMMRHGVQSNGYRGSPESNFGGQQATNEINVPSTLSTDSVMAWLANVKAECCNVVESGRVVGRVTKLQLLSLLSKGFGSMPIGQAMARKP